MAEGFSKQNTRNQNNFDDSHEETIPNIQPAELFLCRHLARVASFEKPLLSSDPASRYVPIRGKLVFTYGIMYFCLALMIASCIVGGGITTLKMNAMLGPPVEALIKMGALRTSLIRAGEWWRLLWAAFLHAGWFHIFMNFVLWWRLGGMIEPDWGFFRFSFVFIISAVSGNLLSSTLDPYNVSVGASGGIFGIMAGCIPYMMGSYKLIVYKIFFLFCYITEYWHTIPNAKYLFGIVLASLVIGLGCGFMPYLDNYAHIGGALGGLLSGLLTITKLQIGTLPPKKLHSRTRDLYGSTELHQMATALRLSKKELHMLISSLTPHCSVSARERLFNNNLITCADNPNVNESSNSVETKASLNRDFDGEQYFSHQPSTLIPSSLFAESPLSTKYDDSHDSQGGSCALHVMGDQTARNQSIRSSCKQDLTKMLTAGRQTSIGGIAMSECNSNLDTHEQRMETNVQSNTGEFERNRLSTQSLTRHNNCTKSGSPYYNARRMSDISNDYFKSTEKAAIPGFKVGDAFQQLCQTHRSTALQGQCWRHPGLATKNREEFKFEMKKAVNGALLTTSFTPSSHHRTSPTCCLKQVSESVSSTSHHTKEQGLPQRQYDWNHIKDLIFRKKVTQKQRIPRRQSLRCTHLEEVDDSFAWKGLKVWYVRLGASAGLVLLWAPLIYFLFICPDCYSAPGQVYQLIHRSTKLNTVLESTKRLLYHDAQLVEGMDDLPIPPLMSTSNDADHSAAISKIDYALESAEGFGDSDHDRLLQGNPADTSDNNNNNPQYLFKWIKTTSEDHDTKHLQLRI